MDTQVNHIVQLAAGTCEVSVDPKLSSPHLVGEKSISHFLFQVARLPRWSWIISVFSMAVGLEYKT